MLCFIRFILPIGSLLRCELLQGGILCHYGKTPTIQPSLILLSWYCIRAVVQNPTHALCKMCKYPNLRNFDKLNPYLGRSKLGRSKLGRNSDGEGESAPTRLLKKTSNEKEACRSRHGRNWITPKNQDTKSMTATLWNAASFRVFLYRFWNGLLWDANYGAAGIPKMTKTYRS